jgi:hypothetical protein
LQQSIRVLLSNDVIAGYDAGKGSVAEADLAKPKDWCDFGRIT